MLDPNRFIVSRRSALAMLVSATGASLLAACGPGAAPAAPTAPPAAPPAAPPTVAIAKPAATTASAPAAAASVSTPAPAAQQAIKTGGTLRWGQVGDLVTIDAIMWSPVANNTLGQVNEMLIDYDDDLKIMPRLAESWEQSADNTSIKLNLREGVQFHTGREFTSDDVEYNILRARDPKNPFAPVVAVGSNWWTSWEKPDKYTIVLKSDKPRPGVFDFLQYLRILDKDTMDGPDATTKVVIPDADRLRNDSKCKLYKTHDLGQYFYAIVNCGQAPTNNKLVRQALNYAIDRQRFTDTVRKGFTGEPRALHPGRPGNDRRQSQSETDRSADIYAARPRAESAVQWHAAECGCIHAVVRSRLGICAQSHVWLCQQRGRVLR